MQVKNFQAEEQEIFWKRPRRKTVFQKLELFNEVVYDYVTLTNIFLTSVDSHNA